MFVSFIARIFERKKFLLAKRNEKVTRLFKTSALNEKLNGEFTCGCPLKSLNFGTLILSSSAGNIFYFDRKHASSPKCSTVEMRISDNQRDEVNFPAAFLRVF